MLHVYVSPQCETDAAAIGMSAEVEKLKEKLEREQSTLGLQRHPKPFLKKSFGRTRLVIAEVLVGEDVVLCLLRHVYKHEIGDNYEAFFSKIPVPTATDPELVEFLRKAREVPIVTKPVATELELAYLNLPSHQTGEGLTVLESPTWTSAIRTLKDTPGKAGLLTPIWELVEKICSTIPAKREEATALVHTRHPVRVHYRYFPQDNRLLLLSAGDSSVEPSSEIRQLVDESEHFDHLAILRNAIRAYPDFIVFDREVWETAQSSQEANLALSPEESDVLNEVLRSEKSGGFPLFINGRPGSGKSTILQYLFADYLHAHLARKGDQRLPHPPLYLTYNDRLLQQGKKVVEDIFRCGVEKLAANETVDLADANTRLQFDGAFGYFRQFLLDLLPIKAGFENRGYVDFNRFSNLYRTVLQGPDAKLRKLSPEVVWHTLRTYIKGKSPGKGDYFDPASYAELPRNEITVEPDTYERVWDKVWNGWYRGLCEKEGRWDDQDLARHVLDSELVPSMHPAIFCDEAQDFTTVELELIFRLSLFSTRKVDSYYLSHVPFAFAGDPFQTLNPTGFRWEAIKSNFHTNIVKQLDPADQSKVTLNFRELAYNYRSTGNIVRFCNLIQLQRAALFHLSEVEPQKPWSLDDGSWPAHFEVSDLSCQSKLKEQTELVLVVPCQEGEEKSFIQNDDFLRTFALNDKGEVSRNVLSPMRAKGLEFARVVLYKFGEQAVSDERTKMIAKLSEAQEQPVKREETLGLEYFFNGLYVGASRAQRKLLVVDTQRGIAGFWPFATAGMHVALLTQRRRKHWSEKDIGHVIRGTATTWAEDRDDPHQQADQFFQQGSIERSTYLLQLARNQYTTLGDDARTERCLALIFDIDGNFRAAGESYLRLNELEDSIRCFWEAGANQEALNVGRKDLGRLGKSPYFLTAKFLVEARSEGSIATFIRDLSAALNDQHSFDIGSPRWTTIIDLAVSSLLPFMKDDSIAAWPWAREVSNALLSMRDRHGLSVPPSEPLAALAFRAGDHRLALDIWDRLVQERPIFRKEIAEPTFIVRARVTTSVYPNKLKWLDKLHDENAIIEEYEHQGDSGFTPEDRAIVLRSLQNAERHEAVLGILRRAPTWSTVEKCAKVLSPDSTSKQGATAALAMLIRTGVEEGHFRKIVDLIDKPESNEIPAIAVVLQSESVKDQAVAALVRLLARSDRFSTEKADQNYVGGHLQRWGQKKRDPIQRYASAQELGAAVERTPRSLDALKFYESIFLEKLWGSDHELINFAKGRWLKCKERQAENDPRKKDKLLREAKEAARTWGIKTPAESYPALSAISPSAIEQIFDSTAPRDQEAKTPSSIPSPASKTTSPRIQPAPSEELIPDIPAISGRVDSTFTLSGKTFELRSLAKQRRIEIRNRETEDLVIVLAKDHVVESHDLLVSKGADQSWLVAEWEIGVSLLSVGKIGLVDLRTLDGKRVFCQVI